MKFEVLQALTLKVQVSPFSAAAGFLTEGQANQLARECEDKNSNLAWKTLASLTAAWRDVIQAQKHQGHA